jgi:hypothetical protein
MNLLRNPGNAIYGVVSLGAFLCGFLISVILIAGFGYAGIAGDAPGDPAYGRYTVAAVAGFLGTAMLTVGLVGTTSARRPFPIFTIIGSALLILLLFPYATVAVRGNAQIFPLLLFFMQLSALILSSLKLKQLQTQR